MRGVLPVAGRVGVLQIRGRRAGVEFAGALVALVFVLALAGAPARAGVTHTYLSQLTGFGNPVALTVDSSGDVYVADSGVGVVDRFSSSGATLNFSASASYIEGARLTGTPAGRFEGPTGVAVNSSSGEVYVSEGGAVDVFSASGEYLSRLTGTPSSAVVHGPFGRSSPEALAVDQANGNLYVLDNERHIVDVFSVAGAYLSQFGAQTLDRFANSVAVNELTGNAYVGDPSGGGGYNVFVFDSTGGFIPPVWKGASTPANSFSGSVHVGLDQANGHVYVTDTGNRVVDEFNASVSESYAGQLTGIPSGHFSGPRAVAVDPSSDRLYVADNSGVVDVFGPDITIPDVSTGSVSNPGSTTATLNGSVNPSGVQVSDCHFDYGTSAAYGQSAACAPGPGSGNVSVPVHADVVGLQPLTSYHYRLVASNAGGTTVGFDMTFITPVLPVVSGESVSNVGSASASIQAQVDPGAAQTTYQVEYGASTAYGSTTPPASLGDGVGAVGVLAQLSGLQPETTYHFRVVATNPVGTAQGSDLTFTTFAASSASGSSLPDNRVYEMVTPAINQNANVLPETGLGGSLSTWLQEQASLDGNAVVYGAESTSAGTSEANQYLATRSAAGAWTQVDIQPPGYVGAQYQAFSSDLSVGILDSSVAELPVLAAGAPGGGYSVLYARNNSNDSYHALFTTTPPNRSPEKFGTGTAGYTENYLTYAGASSDLTHLLFEANDALTAPAVDGGEEANNLYESVGGQLRLVNVLPNGTTHPNSSFGYPGAGRDNPPDFSHVISADGSRIFWTDLNTHDLYVRENGATTVQVDASQGKGGGGGGQFWTAGSDGSKVFFTDSDSAGLTNDTVPNSGSNLYEYDVPSGHLTDLTPSPEAAVEGVVGASEDGEFVYFVAGGNLAGGAVAGFPNLYLHHAGVTTFIATLSPEDNSLPTGGNGNHGDWQPGVGHRSAEVTPDGHSLVFISRQNLTGYDNALNYEVYVYNADAGLLSCASCDPSGAPTYAYLPQLKRGATYVPQWLSHDGSRVFFDSLVPLVPQDTNGQSDVYEWERYGAGSCRRVGGCIYLLSGGTSSDRSTFAAASASGNDVFIATRAQLVAGDRNGNFDLYDVRVNGLRALSPPACSGSGCQGVPPAPPIFATPSSVTFSGVGNFAAPSSVSVKGKQKHKQHKKRKKHRGKKAKKASRRGRAYGQAGRS